MSEEDIQDEQLEEGAVEEGAVEEPVLSDEEKEALLDGIASGEVEVHSTQGPRYAEVSDFVISPRAHIVTNGYPRLDLLNSQLAALLAKTTEKLLNTPVRLHHGEIEEIDFGELEERDENAALVVDFTAKPLEGIALAYFDAGVVAQLVECFFGGSSDEPSTQNTGFFTAGERAVVQKFTQQLLESVAETWSTFTPIEPQQQGIYLSSDLIEGIDKSTKVISCTFSITINDADRSFRLLWPQSTIKTLIPAFRDQKRDADPVQDAHWNKVISGKLTDSVVPVSSEVGRTTMSLRDVAELEAGDIVDIEDPRRSILFARGVPVLEGQFGVHNGHYAIEATRWLAETEST